MGKARHVRNILDEILRKWEKGKIKKGKAVRLAWDRALEYETKRHARPISFKKGVLTVLVEDSSWLYKLTIEKKKTLEKFNEEYKGRKKATDIRFRIGVLDER